MSKSHLVSIFIPYYNDDKYLRGSIESALNQTYENSEIILLNHASTDSSREIAHSYQDNRIKHIDMEKNAGAGGGLLFLKLLETAKGKYIKPFCADDIMLPDAVENLVTYMEANPEKDFVFGNMRYVDKNRKDLKTTWFRYRSCFNLNNDENKTLLLHFNGTGHLPYPGSIIKLDALKNIKIDKISILFFDMTLWPQLLINGSKIGFLDKEVAMYRVHEGQASSSSEHQETISMNIASFESIKYCDFFYNITNVETVKYLCSGERFTNLLTEADQEFIPFVIAYHYINSDKIPYILSGRLKIFDMLSDDITREKIEKKFGYGIKDFREHYKNMPLIQISKKNVFIDPKKISIPKLAHLLSRKIFYLLTFKRKKRKLSL
ncbi:MAG: glycosyltransferase family 2 protein [Endomicrobia bacterium]|nr:glycosyltransferase family 2 protein [Endomicrobiia bacterium]